MTLAPSDDGCLLFLHLPKTAGVAITDAIADHVPNHFHVANSIEPLRDPRDFISGHFQFGVHTALPWLKTPQYITVLRDPVDRALSHYGQHLRNAPVPDEGRKPQGVREWMERFPSQAGNMQTRFLCGLVDGWTYSELCSHGPVEPLTDLHLRAAKLALSMFLAVGTYERLTEFGVPGLPPLELTPTNVFPRPQRDEISPSLLRRIEDSNELDWELWQYARSLA